MSDTYEGLDDGYKDSHNNIKNLINNTINNINTIYLAEVMRVEDNKVTIKNVVAPDVDAQPLIVQNVLIAQPFGGGFSIKYPIKPGDIGIALVCKMDISTYKYTGEPGVVNTNRKFNVNDSVFIPLMPYTLHPMENEGLVLTNSNAKVTIKLTDDEVTINANKVHINTQHGSYKDAIMKVVQLCQILKNSLQGSATNPAQYNAQGLIIENEIARILE